jgi:hypothetical protein
MFKLGDKVMVIAGRSGSNSPGTDGKWYLINGLWYPEDSICAISQVEAVFVNEVNGTAPLTDITKKFDAAPIVYKGAVSREHIAISKADTLAQAILCGLPVHFTNDLSCIKSLSDEDRKKLGELVGRMRDSDPYKRQWSCEEHTLTLFASAGVAFGKYDSVDEFIKAGEFLLKRWSDTQTFVKLGDKVTVIGEKEPQVWVVDEIWDGGQVMLRIGENFQVLQAERLQRFEEPPPIPYLPYRVGDRVRVWSGHLYGDARNKVYTVNVVGRKQSDKLGYGMLECPHYGLFWPSELSLVNRMFHVGDKVRVKKTKHEGIVERVIVERLLNTQVIAIAGLDIFYSPADLDLLAFSEQVGTAEQAGATEPDTFQDEESSRWGG